MFITAAAATITIILITIASMTMAADIVSVSQSSGL